MFLMLSLGVGKRQADEVSLKTALMSPFRAQSKMLKTSTVALVLKGIVLI